MRRKAIIVLTITIMVTVMVTAFSYLYISQILRQRIDNTYESADRLNKQLAYFAENDLPDLTSTRIDTNDRTAVRRALAAVSYTHLDVYKRQVPRGARTAPSTLPPVALTAAMVSRSSA